MSTLYLNGVGEVELVRSARRTIAAEIRPDGRVLVRAPKRYPQYLILGFLERRRDWILINRTKVLQKNSLGRQQGEEKYQEMMAQFGSGKKAIEKMRKRTREILLQKVPSFAERIGVSYGRLSVRAMKSRWGSCSIKGDLSFNILLSELPEDTINYVVIHELCHRKEMNHSTRFWQLVGQYDPAYKEHRRYLKDSGTSLILLLERLKDDH